MLDGMAMGRLINALADELYEHDPTGSSIESQVLMMPRRSRGEFDTDLMPGVLLMLNAVRHVVRLSEEV